MRRSVPGRSSAELVAGALDREWPDPDKRNDALERVQAAVNQADRIWPLGYADMYPTLREDPDAYTRRPRKRVELDRRELRVLECLSHGMGRQGAADSLGLTLEMVKYSLLESRRVLRAKDVTHACCEALRQGLIR